MPAETSVDLQVTVSDETIQDWLDGIANTCGNPRLQVSAKVNNEPYLWHPSSIT